MAYLYSRVLFVAVPGFLGACTVTPQFDGGPSGPPIAAITNEIHCEILDAVIENSQLATEGSGPRASAGWTAGVDLSLQVDENGGLSPTLTSIMPYATLAQSLTVVGTFQANTMSQRIYLQSIAVSIRSLVFDNDAAARANAGDQTKRGLPEAAQRHQNDPDKDIAAAVAALAAALAAENAEKAAQKASDDAADEYARRPFDAARALAAANARIAAREATKAARKADGAAAKVEKPLIVAVAKERLKQKSCGAEKTRYDVAGNLGIAEFAAMGFKATEIDVDKFGGGKLSDAFAQSVQFVVDRNISASGPTWTLTHFKGPGGILSLGRKDTHKVTVGFTPPKPIPAVTGGAAAALAYAPNAAVRPFDQNDRLFIQSLPNTIINGVRAPQ